MPWYSFVIEWPDGRSHDAGITRLYDHHAARRYARLIVRELKQQPGYHDPEVRMIVKDADGEVIHVIPL